jgi:hypothetical protein
MLDAQVLVNDEAAGVAFDRDGAEVHVRNNLFTRYRTRADADVLFLDRYPNSDFADRLPAGRYRVTARGIDSVLSTDGDCRVAHLLPARPMSLFAECSDRLANGGLIEDAWVEQLAAFFVGLRESASQHPDFAAAWRGGQRARIVLDTMQKRAWLDAADLDVAAALLRSAAVFYDVERLDGRYPILLRASLDDLVRDRSGAIIGLPILQAGSWPLLVGQALSNLVEICWHFRANADVGLRALRVAAAALGLDLWTVLSVTLDGLFEHGYVNVWESGGEPANLRGLVPLVTVLSSAATTDAA